MPEFAELGQRITALCARAMLETYDARLLVEIEELLAEGYMCALRGDHRRRALQRRLEALLDEDASDDAARELQTLAREQRVVAEATRELRAQLEAMREQCAAAYAFRHGLVEDDARSR